MGKIHITWLQYVCHYESCFYIEDFFIHRYFHLIKGQRNKRWGYWCDLLLGLHIGASSLQFPEFSQVTVLGPSLENPSLQIKEAPVSWGYPPFNEDVLYCTSPFSKLREEQVTESKKSLYSSLYLRMVYQKWIE